MSIASDLRHSPRSLLREPGCSGCALMMRARSSSVHPFSARPLARCQERVTAKKAAKTHAKKKPPKWGHSVEGLLLPAPQRPPPSVRSRTTRRGCTVSQLRHRALL
jgi:hypothetical protein